MVCTIFDVGSQLVDSVPFYVPDLRREGHYEMMAGVCLSVCLFIACFNLLDNGKA